MTKLIQMAAFAFVAMMIGILLYWQVEIIHLGGPVMIPIIMCSVFSVTITGERLYYFFRLHLGKDIEGYFEQLRQTVEKHQWKEAQVVCESWQGPVARVALGNLPDRT